VDLLLRPEEIETAGEILRTLGFALDERTQTAAFYRAHHFHLIYRHLQRPWCCFELHWDLTIPCMDSCLQTERLRQRATPTHLAGHTVRIPGPEQFLLHACLHASLSAFSNLSQIRDIQALASRRDCVVDPALLWNLARAGGTVTPTVIGLDLAQLFGATAELASLRRSAPSPATRSALIAVLRPATLLRRRLPQSAAGSTLVSLLRRDRLANRLRHLARQIAPSLADLGVDGHPVGTTDRTDRRHFSRHGLALVIRAGLYWLLSAGGWEIARSLHPALGHEARDSAAQG
jgi:hypothetical protein